MSLCLYLLSYILVALARSDGDQRASPKYGQVYEDDPSLVQTPYGMIQGSIFANKVVMFRSIPYAEPPVDENRWSAPMPKQPWGINNTVDATQDPPGCPQVCSLPPHTCPLTQSEDCLFLNVFRPINTSTNDPLPVMIFFHGGNFYQGYSGGPLYNESNMVLETDVITVTVNYRLGALGFLWSATGPSGNYGMLDQMLAIEWVHDNIAYFNGDPNQVVLYGQSAGAISVALHMAHNYPNNLGLFQAAIMESEPFGIPIRDTLTWGLLPNNFYNNLGCDYDKINHNEAAFWQCLRNKTVDEIVSAQMTTQLNPANEFDHFWDLFLPWSPTAGTPLYSEQVFWSFQQGHYVDVPYIIGVCENEGVSFVYEVFAGGLTEPQMLALMEVLVGNGDTDAIINRYPLPPRENTTDYRPYAALITTDGLFRCPSWNATMQHSVLKETETAFANSAWFYHFDHVSSFSEAMWGKNYTFCDDKVCHAAELPYVFHPNGAMDNASYTAAENELAFTMQTFWGNMAKHKQPGKSGNLTWSAFEALNKQYSMVFNAPGTQLMANVDNDTCQFWNGLNYNWIK